MPDLSWRTSEFRHDFALSSPLPDALEAFESACRGGELRRWRGHICDWAPDGSWVRVRAERSLRRQMRLRGSGFLGSLAENHFDATDFRRLQVSVPYEFRFDCTLRWAPYGTAVETVVSEEIDPLQDAFNHGGFKVDSLLALPGRSGSELEQQLQRAGSGAWRSPPSRQGSRPAARRSVKQWSQASLRLLVDEGLLEGYVDSGKFTRPRITRPIVPEEARRLAHYRPCEGPLYQDEAAWQAAYRLVKSFVASGAGGGERLTLRSLYGRIPEEIDVVFGRLPQVLQRLGFSTTEDKASRTVRFEASGQAKVADLPEPYGKWLQIKEGRPRWDEPAELELRGACRLRDLGQLETALDLELSAFAFALLDDLRLGLSDALHLAAPLPSPTLQYRLSQLVTSSQQGTLGTWVKPLVARGVDKLDAAAGRPALPVRRRG